jgi:plasmid stabilization system protein ParE
VKLRFTKRAVRQIEEIIGAIALESPQGARRVRERMQSITTLLIEHPQIGQQTDVAASGACWSSLTPTSSSIALPRMP